ncbi:MAG: hypothetical protein QW534_07110 [Candidatus Methanomethylicia archaeon]
MKLISSKKGQGRLIEGALACLILLICFGSAMYIVGVKAQTVMRVFDLEDLAYSVLSILDEDGLLVKAVYFGRMDELRNALNTLIPLSIGYRFEVRDLNGYVEQALEGNGFKAGDTESAIYILSCYANLDNPRIIVLILSR